MTPRLYFEYSVWFFIVCLLVGTGYAILLYYRAKTPWGNSTNRILFFLRFALISLLAGLLVGPFLRLTKNNFEKPLIVFAIDNSASMKLSSDSISLSRLMLDLKQLESNLEDAGFETRSRTLDLANSEEEIQFEHQETDLSALMKGIANDFQGFNLSSVVLFSDGIYNTGISPTYSSYTYPVNTIGAGDTTRNKDLIIQNVLYNKLSYQGNQFPVVVEILNEGYIGESANITIYKGNKILESKTIDFSRNGQINTIEFLLDADEVGLQRYTVNLERKDGEFTNTNNRVEVFIDVIDGKERILVVAASPHPDIKAIVSAVQANDNYEVNTYIPGIHQLPNDLTTMDLVIFHQIPDYRQSLGPDLNKLMNLDAPKLYVVGAQTNLTALNTLMNPVNIVRSRNESDLITPVTNQDFGLFEISDELNDLINQMPPVRSPFGNINYDSESNILLFQRVGSITTMRPLLLFRSENDKKSGVLFAEGLWKWKLFDFAENKTNVLFNELVLKTVQYLTTKDDKRKFRVYPRKNEYFEKESIVFQAEAYNALYDPVYGIKVDLILTNEIGESRNFTFVTSQSNTSFSIRSLEAGIYKYSGTAIVNNESISVGGEFMVKEMNIESVNLTADHHLLMDLAAKSGGDFYTASNISQLEASLIQSKPPELIHTTEQFLPMINIQWAFFMLLVLITSEWFLRKYQGSY